MSISLKKAYSACLWLAERKLGIPVEEQRGEWDLEAKDKNLDWKREELVTALPFNYYEHNPLYSYYDDEENTCIDASNFIDGHLFADESDNAFYRYSPNRNRQFFHPQRKEVSETEHEADESIAWNELPLLTIDELDDSSCKEEDKPALASIAAHLTLMEKLQFGEVTAKGFVHFTHFPESITAERNQHTHAVDLPPIYWHNNPIPNYELSSVEEGLQRHMAMISYFDNAKFKPDWDLLSVSEFWHKGIQIEGNFSGWLMEQVRKAFPTPAQATFKPQGKGFLIQFGTDKEGIVRGSKGMTLLYKIMKEYRKSTYNEGSGYALEEIVSDIEQESLRRLGNDNSLSIKQSGSKAGLKQKMKNNLFALISRYYESEDIDEKEEIEDKCCKALNFINKHESSEILRVKDLKNILRQNIDWSQAEESIKLSLKPDDTPEEAKSIESHRKNLENALDKLREQAPHLAYYLGPLKSKKALGLGYNQDPEEFYFICKDSIEWDFG
ncbi:hypothetical protein [Photobacterium sp. OFAV2-7]|uniref:hypothetical protein n=1 Tax=Photobacterium sp. OFAV2-7 TaxID=2917748 RepID=UPI001EF4805A|nr:hypothetical protein [Photobacterium sp. OFAV2-7]MCG7584951.1 hypothetical protein [Photobacterium sp. OFAV2-7]